MGVLIPRLLCHYVTSFVGLSLQCWCLNANLKILIKRPASVKSDDDQRDDKTIF